jgi:hypothetical protein
VFVEEFLYISLHLSYSHFEGVVNYSLLLFTKVGEFSISLLIFLADLSVLVALLIVPVCS